MIDGCARGSGKHRARARGTRAGVLLVALAAGLLVALTFAAGAHADFTVNDTGDDGDAGVVRDGICATVTGKCTLRAAIGEANANPDADTIDFDPAVFTGTASTSTIDATGPGPSITATATVDGGDCDPTSGFKPCVGFEASGGQPGLSVSGDNVEIRGLAITNGSTGLHVFDNANGVKVAGNWFGLRLDETAQGNSRGIELVGKAVPDLPGTTVGGETAADRNVFAHNTADGVRITGGDDNLIKGNYFGTKPDGTTAAPNGGGVGTDNIEVSSVGGTANPASSNVIGGTQSAAQLATPECDGPCNVIANSSDGVDLETEGAPDGSPVSSTTIKGNFIGLDVTGDSAAPNLNRGIRASTSSATNSPLVVGGPDPGDRNVISGNTQGGVLASGGTTLRNNYFSSNSEGDEAVPNMFGDASVGTNDTPTTSIVQDNRFVGDGVSGGRLTLGGGTKAIGNTFGIGTGGEALAIDTSPILVTENFDEIGGPDPGDANTIGNVLGDNPAILILGGNANNVRGNLVGVTANGSAVPNAGPGIQVTNSFTNTALDNTIGGDTPAEENLISNSGGDAIEIVDQDSPSPINNSGNEILRNRGSGGSDPNDLFIDLRTHAVGDGLGNPVDGPNGGIQAVSLDAPTSTQITGTAADLGATIRVFKTVDENVRGIRGFVDEETDGDGGEWAVTFPSPLPDGQCLSATQTDVSNNTSELPAAVPIDPEPTGDPCDVVPPTVDIGSPAADATTGPEPTFTFASDDAADSYECRFDSDTFAPCSDPTGDTGSHEPNAPLTEGSHTFQVRGTDAVGNTGAAASRTITVDATPPETTIGSGPAEGSTTADSTPTFGFSSTEAGSTFECQLDAGGFADCTNPATVGPLSDGPHTFQVRATDQAANVDTSPASRSFTVDTTVSPEPGPDPEPTPEPEPTPDPEPSNDFTIGKLKGTVLTLSVPGPGAVQVVDAGGQAASARAAAGKRLLKPSAATAPAAGAVKVKLKLVRAAKKRLKAKGRVKVRAAITYTPTGGTANTQTKALKIRRKKPKG